MATLAIWCDGPADGATNMAADELLATEARLRGEPLVRIYRWESPTVSLGAFQPLAGLPACSPAPGGGAAREPGAADARAPLAGGPGELRPATGGPAVRLVRRPSGGAAIVHGTDISYAVALPAGHAWARSAAILYRAVHEPLVAELEGRGVRAWIHGAAGAGDTGRDAAGASPEFFCFARRAAGDVVVSPTGRRQRGRSDPPDLKVLGAAQRRLAGVVLQHGSLLIHTNTEVPPSWRHGSLEDLGVGVDDAGVELVRSWMDRLATALGRGVSRQDGQFGSDPDLAREIVARAIRFREPRWLGRR